MLLVMCTMTTISYTQNKTIDMKTVSNLPENMACKLTGPELHQRKAALQQEVFAHVIRTEEVEEGYVFYFPDEDDFLIKLVDYMLAEKKCCPFFGYQLAIEPNGAGANIKVLASPDAKAMIKTMIEEQGN